MEGGLSASDLSQMTEDDEQVFQSSCSHSIRLMNKAGISDDVDNQQDCIVVHHDDDTDDDFNDQTDDLDMLLNTYTLGNCMQSRLCFVIFYLCVVLLLIASGVAMVVVLVMIVAPYHRVTGFLDTTCVVTDVGWYGERSQCSCGKGCTSDYPCILITVSNPRNVNSTSLIYEHESLLNEQCSYAPRCSSSRASNEHAVTVYAEEYGVLTKNYSCLYNPLNPKEIIRRRRFLTPYVVHATVWPSLALVLLLSVCVCHVYKRGCGNNLPLYK